MAERRDDESKNRAREGADEGDKEPKSRDEHGHQADHDDYACSDAPVHPPAFPVRNPLLKPWLRIHT